jgi:hypothetical protein
MRAKVARTLARLLSRAQRHPSMSGLSFALGGPTGCCRTARIPPGQRLRVNAEHSEPKDAFTRSGAGGSLDGGSAGSEGHDGRDVPGIRKPAGCAGSHSYCCLRVATGLHAYQADSGRLDYWRPQVFPHKCRPFASARTPVDWDDRR